MKKPTNKRAPGEKLYTFRGEYFYSSPATISQLNYALGLNRSSERYVLTSLKQMKEDLNE